MNSSGTPSSSEQSAVNRTRTITTPYGRGLETSTLISAGSIILSTHAPYHLLPENAVLSSVCSYCLFPPPLLSPPSPLKRCARCQVPYYCSPKCQKADWNSVHKTECSILASLPAQLPTPVRALLQILLRKDRGEPWKGLESHEIEFRKDKLRWEDMVLQAKAAVSFAKLGDEKLNVAIGLLCRMKTNSFRFTSEVGAGLLFDPVLAMANHSCDPNAEIECGGRTVQLVALREIREGEEAFISYINEDDPVNVRREQLKSRYFFDCECERCVRQKKDGGDDPA